MALLVDGGINRVEDLREWDSGILDVAHGERIDLGVKLRRAQAEIEEEVERFLRDQERGAITQVVADRGMRHWHALKTLEAVYRDAYFNQLNERFGGKWKHYLELAEKQALRYFDAGVAIVYQPLRRPPQVAVTAGDGELPPATYRFVATVVDAEGRESAPSEEVVVSVPAPHSLLARLPYSPEGATGWNIYAGLSDGDLALQSNSPLGLQEPWSLSPDGLRTGRPPGDGQAPDEVIRRNGPILLRG